MSPPVSTEFRQEFRNSGSPAYIILDEFGPSNEPDEDMMICDDHPSNEGLDPLLAYYELLFHQWYASEANQSLKQDHVPPGSDCTCGPTWECPHLLHPRENAPDLDDKPDDLPDDKMTPTLAQVVGLEPIDEEMHHFGEDYQLPATPGFHEDVAVENPYPTEP